MVAALLHLEGFEDVDPQHPLGGPDGLKDVLCRKAGGLWIVAAYFPTTSTSFAAIRTKFHDDSAGIAKNAAAGFAFFVNQHLTIGERQDLFSISTAKNTEIYHLERISAILNSPKGCGIRLEYLRIPMTEAEQWAFWSTMNADIAKTIADNEIRRDLQIQELGTKMDVILARTNAIENDGNTHASSISGLPGIDDRIEMPTSKLSLSALCWLHRIITEDSGLPESVRGRLRAVQVWIGPAGSKQSDASHIPPSPEQIEPLTSEFLTWWQWRHVELRGAKKSDIAKGLSEFHHRFLSIHPFVDANGRLGRLLLDQAARELLDQEVGSYFTSDPNGYYAALRSADNGNLEPLYQRVLASLK